VAAAGKALAGWADPNGKVIAPTLEAIYNDNNRDAIDSFCRELFEYTPISELLSTKLKGFRSRMVASLLMHYTSVKKALGRDCSIIKKIKLAWFEAKLEIIDIERYGDMIKERFQFDNAFMLAADGSESREAQFKKAFNSMHEVSLKTLDKVTKLEGSIAKMEEDIADIKVMMET